MFPRNISILTGQKHAENDIANPASFRHLRLNAHKPLPLPAWEVGGSKGQNFGKPAGGGSFGASPEEGGGRPMGNPLVQRIGNSPGQASYLNVMLTAAEIGRHLG